MTIVVEEKNLKLDHYLSEIFNKSMTIDEKIQFYNYQSEEVNCDKLKEWKSIKSLVKDSHFEEMLNSRKLTEKQFAFGVSAMKLDVNHNFPFWLSLLKKMIVNHTSSRDERGIYIAIAPFVNYVKEKLKEKKNQTGYLSMEDTVIDKFLENYALEISNIVGKIIVIELEMYKKENLFKSENTEKRFDEFLQSTFNGKMAYAEFYSRYAVVGRLIATRTHFFLENYENLLLAIEECKSEICHLLGKDELRLSDVNLSAGDSHENGKSVIILNFENRKIVYKPKNSSVSEGFEKFTSWINNSSNLLDVKIPKGIYRDSFSFQEFIDYKECETQEDVENFYLRMGHLIALSYILNMNDLHVENIIAYKDYPVIIDGETLFHNEHNLDLRDKPYSKINLHISSETLMQSGLLPYSVQISDDHGTLIDLSGTSSGGNNEIIAKGLKPVDVNKDTFRFEDQEIKRKKGNNIPKKDNEYIGFKEYRHLIIQGFLEMSNFIVEQKPLLLSEDSPLNYFKNTKIRCLLKGTQTYSSLLGFSSHPNYTKEMFYREKLFENIWAYPHMDKRVILSEYNDLLNGDIPIFYSKVDSIDLEDSRGKIIGDFFRHSGLELSINRIKNFDLHEIEYQLGFLLVSLEIVKENYIASKNNRKKLPSKNSKIDGLFYAKKIASKLEDKAVWNSRHDEVSWMTIDVMRPSKRIGIYYANEGLYDGLSGISYYYLMLFIATKEDRYFDMYKSVMKSAIDFANKCPLVSAFEGCLSPIYPILIENKYLGSSTFNNYIFNTIEKIDTSKMKEHESVDWINGLSGIMALMVEISKIFAIPKVDVIIEELQAELLIRLKDMQSEKQNIGFAHGYSGIAYALSKVDQKNKSDKNEKIIIDLLEKEYGLINNQKDQRWCWGIPGMLKARLEMDKARSNEVIAFQKNALVDLFLNNIEEYSVQDDTLCHGNSGIISILVKLKNYELNTNQIEIINCYLNKYSLMIVENQLISDNFSLLALPQIEPVGLFTGISGIGLSLLETSFDISSDIQMLLS
ncbi:type 2 lanthipeptide synthetase LanM family protein (plasmid) [Bacillus bombysepticus]|nr:type 2 lanthipeptide synthetase LanM family protein [Bacillus bombysepticus]